MHGMFYLWLTIIVSAVIILTLGIRIYLLRRAAREISAQLKEKLANDTNTLLTVSTKDKSMCHLANELNAELRKLQSQRHRFQQGDLELKNAITNISHDLRTPLTAINGYLDLLEQEEKSEAVSRYLGIIKNRTETLKELTEEFFRYSVIISPENEIPAEPVVVNGVLEESIVSFYAALQERKITPSINMPEQKVVRTVNRDALSRIFSNLINNALKYSDGDLKITLTEAGRIIFSNAASKLSEVEVERLFDRFYTVENARKSTGLGLAISRTLIEQMNGTITAKYENGRLGICVWLPDGDSIGG